MASLYERPAREQRGELVWNVLSVLVMLSMAGLLIAFLQIYSNPASQINPFPPPTQVALLVVPTGTITLIPSPVTPSPQPSATVAFSETPTLTPTQTEIPTETPTLGPSPTSTINSAYPFILDTTSIISGDVFHAGEGCKLWVAGQALDLQRAPMVGITVMLGGNLNGGTLYQLSLTGTALQYGPAGYEFTVADLPAESSRAVWVMLLDQSGSPLSNRTYFDTFEDCGKNSILVNFRRIR